MRKSFYRTATLLILALTPYCLTAGEPGKIKREVWTGIPGNAIADLTGNAKFHGTPDVIELLSTPKTQQFWGNDYGQRLRGYITAPESGDYTFWVSGDNHCDLYLSTDTSKFNKVRIAYISGLPGWTNVEQWDRFPTQQSATITLVAGQKYFIEALNKAGGGGDHVEIAWKTPSGQQELIPSSALESFTVDPDDADDDELKDSWETAHGFSTSDDGSVDIDNGPLGDPDGDGVTNIVEFEAGTNPLVFEGAPGKMKREVWTGIPGNEIADLTGDPKFYAAPDVVELIDGPKTPNFWGDDYGQRLRGYITAPESGDYTFWVSGDNHCDLYLSTDQSKFNKARIAYISGKPGWTNVEQWDRFPTQQSVAITLVAGQKYFIEALNKAGGGGDHVEIAWKTPSGQQELIPASALEAFVIDADDADDDDLRDSWETTYGLSTTDDGTIDPNNGPLGDQDLDGYANLEEHQFGTDPTVYGGVPGYLSYDTWFAKHGTSLAILRSLPTFYGEPLTRELLSAAEAPVNAGDHFGARLSGYIVAPVSGDYTFWEAGDENAELWLSTDTSKFNKQLIASHVGKTNHREWDKYPSQKSATITLVAGQKYYIEALVKEATGADHLSLAWQIDDGVREVIPDTAIESAAIDPDDRDDDGLRDSWETVNGLDPTTDVGDDGPLGDPDGDYAPNWLEQQAGTDPQTADESVPGALVYEEWNGIPGRFVKDFKESSRFLQEPDQRFAVVTGSGPSNNVQDLGNRIRGYITAPTTGDYVFWAEGNKEVEFWLSTSQDKFDKELLIRTAHFTQPFEFDKDIFQKSKVVQLVAGQKYYLECYHKMNNAIGNHFNIAWQPPGEELQELPASALSTFRRQANDLDDDDLRDDYELAYGLDPTDNGSTNPVNGANGDLDGDGLLNHEEQTHGTAANLADTDGDGVNDFDEVELLETQALVGDVAPFQVVQTVNGSDFTAHSGGFSPQGSTAYTTGTRGWVEYSVNVPADGTYMLDLTFGPRVGGGLSDEYETVFSIAGETLDRAITTVATGTTGNAKALTPWLTTGAYTVRVLVDNSYTFRSVSLHDLKLLRSHGPDDNANGTPDWVENRIAVKNGVDSGVLQSQVSPVTFEGRARFLASASSAGNDLHPAPGDRWFADVALEDKNGNTNHSFSFENGALTVSRDIKWVATNMLAQEAITIRQGDSLRVSSWDGNGRSGRFTATLTTLPLPTPWLAKETAGYLPTTQATAVLGWSDRLLTNLLEARGVIKGFSHRGDGTAAAYHINTTGTTTTLQLQLFNGFDTKVTKVQLDQAGDDIIAHQIYAKSKSGDHLGEDFDVITSNDVIAGPDGFGVLELELIFNSVSPETTTLAQDQNSSQPVAVAFNVPGTHTVNATWTSANGKTSIDSVMTVRVITSLSGLSNIQSPVCVAGYWREWDVPVLPEGTVLEIDDRIEVRETIDLGDAGTRYIIKGETPDDNYAIVRYEDTGAVLGNIAIRAQRIRDSEKTSLQFIEDYNDGSYLVEMPSVIDGLYPDATVRYEIFVGGVTFDDGSILRDLALPGDADAMGVVPIRFIKTGDRGSICHRVSVWQDGKRIAWFH